MWKKKKHDPYDDDYPWKENFEEEEKSIITKSIDFILYLGIALVWIGLFTSILGCVVFALMSKWEMFAYSYIIFLVSVFLFFAFMIEPKDPGVYNYDEYD